MSWPESLLIVDDQLEIRQSVIKLFASLDMTPAQVFEAKNAEEAIALYDQHHPQLSLVDVVLFGNSGFDVLRHIRQQDEEAVVMMMTAFPQFDYAMEAIRARVDHFLVKPLSAQSLENALMDIMRHKSRRAGAAPMNKSFFTRQLDRVLRGEDGPSHLEKARREAGIDDLPGDGMLLALMDDASDPAAPETLSGAASALGSQCVAFRQADGGLALIMAFDKKRPEHAAHLLSQVLKSLPGAFAAGVSASARETGLMEMHRRAAFALAYSREKKISGLQVYYERLDLGRILLSRCHGTLMEAYDLADETRFMDAMDEWMILLRQHGAPEQSWDALNEMYAIEGLPPLEEQTERDAENIYRAAVAHFHGNSVPSHLPPPALHLSLLRRYLLENGGTLDHGTLSSLTGLSYGYLSELFRQYRGQSLSEYARALRLRQAAELLAGTGCRVYEAARLTGFEGNKHFYGLFQKMYGHTPVQYHAIRYGETENAP